MYKQMLCPRPIPRILVRQINPLGVLDPLFTEAYKFLRKKIGESSVIYDRNMRIRLCWWNFTENSLEFPLHDCYHGFQADFQKKHLKKNHEFMCSVHGLQPSSVKARHAAVTGVACMPPGAKSPDWGTAHRAFFERWELQESMIVGRKNPTKQKTCLLFIIILFLFVSSLCVWK